MNINTLQSKVSQLDGVEIVEGKGGFAFINVKNSAATAQISLYGGQVLSYRPLGQDELLFVSERAYYEEGKAIKGGVPICWPAFGASFTSQGRPFHGFARNRTWQLENVVQPESDLTVVCLQLVEDDESLKIFPYRFKLKLEIHISKELQLKLITENTDVNEFEITQALHTYISVQDISKTTLSGLDKIEYLDKAKSNTGPERKCQQGDVIISSEVDRIYLNVSQQLKLEDASARREIIIYSEGNQTLVVWNPWKDLCEQSADLLDDDYLRFICVETANAADDIIKVKPGNSVGISATYSTVGI